MLKIAFSDFVAGGIVFHEHILLDIFALRVSFLCPRPERSTGTFSNGMVYLFVHPFFSLSVRKFCPVYIKNAITKV